MEENGRSAMRFPWRLSILNGMVLFLVCGILAVKALVTQDSFTAHYWSFLYLVGWAFWTLASLGYHVAIYRLLRFRVRNAPIWVILFLLPAIVLGGDSLYGSFPRVQAKQILSSGQLGPLPRSAKDVRIFTWSSLFAGEKYLRFQANRKDIEAFLASSPILVDAKCQRYSKERMRLKYPKDLGADPEWVRGPHEYFHHRSITPEWFIQEIKGAGRHYEFQSEGYDGPGELIFNEESNLIFVRLVIG